MNPPLLISLESLERGPTTLSGAIPGTVLELEGEAEIRNVGDLVYDLTVERKGTEVLASGSVEASMELECVRSGLFFSTIVRDSAFLRDYSTEETGDILDLTEDVREAVLLQIPSHPVSPEAQSAEFELPKLSSEVARETDRSPWDDLDQLNL